MKVVTLMVGPDGALEIGTATEPVAPNAKAEIIIADQPFTPAEAPEQFGHGIVALGKVRMHGAVKSPTFVRLDGEAVAGQKRLKLQESVGRWRIGDTVVLPETRSAAGQPFESKDETLQIAAISDDGVTSQFPLSFDHRHAREPDGSLGPMPHTSNLTRNVLVRSEHPFGTRGHIIFLSRADVDVRYTEFRDMGRTTTAPLDNTEFDAQGRTTHTGTNQIGRYAIHFHHDFGPVVTPANGYQFTLIGNVVVNAPKWGITVHNSHYGLIQDNIVYRAHGAAIVTEDGSESFNVFDHNFALNIEGSRELGARSGYGPSPESGGEGEGFWFNGLNNYVRNNVAAQGGAYGFAMSPFGPGKVRVPRFKGADTSVESESVMFETTNSIALEFSNNEAYSTEEAFSWCFHCLGSLYVTRGAVVRPSNDPGPHSSADRTSSRK
jgi:hypothetical protein